MAILCSAGHSNIKGLDRGAVGNGFVEGDLAVELRDAVAARLRELGETTVLEDGFDGENDPLKKALALAKQASVAVEFHWNASDNPKAMGIEVLSKPKHKELAQTLARAIGYATGIGLRGVLGWKADNSGQHHRLAFCEANGLIVEVCFITNVDDMERYRDNFEGVSRAIAGVLRATVT